MWYISSIAQLVLRGLRHIAHSMFQSIAQLVVQGFGPLGVERTLGRTTTTPHLSIMDDAAGRVICIWHHHHHWHHHDFHHVQKLITSKSSILRQSDNWAWSSSFLHLMVIFAIVRTQRIWEVWTMIMAIRGKKWEQLQLRLNDGQFWAKNLEQVHCTDGAAEKMQ